MSVWETVMDKSSWQPDIQNCIRGITMEAVTNKPPRHSHSGLNTPIQKCPNSIKVTNCYIPWLNQVSPLWHSNIAIWFESFFLRFAPRNSYSLLGKEVKRFIRPNWLTYDCTDRPPDQPPHTLRFPDSSSRCSQSVSCAPLSLSVLFLCLGLGCMFWQTRIVTNQSSHICLMTPTLPQCSRPSPIGYKLQALDSSIVKMALLSVLMCYKPF